MKINVLSNDIVQKRRYIAEHGLSLYIEHGNDTILFDTGQTGIYCQNAEKSAIDLRNIKRIVLSHGHYDHCGGLEFFPYTDNMPDIFVNRNAFSKKYAANADGTLREIGIPWSAGFYEKIRNRIIYTGKKTEISKDMYVCGEIPSVESFEGIPEGFFINEGNLIAADMIKDEQLLVIDTVKGLYVFLGCSHPGVINCIRYVNSLFPQKNIYMVAGGMHLWNAGMLRLEMTVQYLKGSNIEYILPLHCTGITALCEMKNFLGKRCILLNAGDSIEL